MVLVSSGIDFFPLAKTIIKYPVKTEKYDSSGEKHPVLLEMENKKAANATAVTLIEDVVQQYVQVNMQQYELRDHRDIVRFCLLFSAFSLKVKSHLFKFKFIFELYESNCIFSPFK